MVLFKQGAGVMNYAYEAIFLFFILSVAIYHAKRFANNITTGKWFHFLWALFFGFIIVIMWWLNGKNWFLAGALILERFVFFNPILNYFRKPKRAFFYTRSGTNGSWMDRVLEKGYPVVWVVCAGGFVTIQFFL